MNGDIVGHNDGPNLEREVYVLLGSYGTVNNLLTK